MAAALTRKEVFMKKILKPFGFIVMAALIVFGTLACSNPTGGGGSSGGNNNPTGTGNSGGWPPSTILTKYGITSLTEPAGFTGGFYLDRSVSDTSGTANILDISFTGDSSTTTAVNDYFKDAANSWKDEGSITSSPGTDTTTVYTYSKAPGSLVTFTDTNHSDFLLQVIVSQ